MKKNYMIIGWIYKKKFNYICLQPVKNTIACKVLTSILENTKIVWI